MTPHSNRYRLVNSFMAVSAIDYVIRDVVDGVILQIYEIMANYSAFEYKFNIDYEYDNITGPMILDSISV